MPPSPRVLIVGEDTIIANLISSMLQKEGYSILGIHASGQEAIVRTVELVPDLVIMDVSLAGLMDGIDTAHYLFQLFPGPDPHGHGECREDQLERIKYAQPYGVVFKPFSANEIFTSADLALYNHANRVRVPGDLPLGDTRKMMNNPDEGVIILDKRGRVIFFNITGAWFVDMPLEKAFVRHWRDVMMFMSDTSEEEVSDPVTAATKNMAGSIYDASISIVSTTSKRRKVTLTIRPIRDNHDRLIASVMTLKENKKTYI